MCPAGAGRYTHNYEHHAARLPSRHHHHPHCYLFPGDARQGSQLGAFDVKGHEVHVGDVVLREYGREGSAWDGDAAALLGARSLPLSDDLSVLHVPVLVRRIEIDLFAGGMDALGHHFAIAEFSQVCSKLWICLHTNALSMIKPSKTRRRRRLGLKRAAYRLAFETRVR